MPITGSVGINLVILSATAGISENEYSAPTVEAAEVTMEDVRAYRRRTVRIRKKVFQSRAVEGVGEDESEVIEGFAVVDAFLVRHSEGVKNDDGVVVEGGFAARGENLEARSWG